MAVVSNFDLRLRPLLKALGLDQLFDALIISAEVSTWTRSENSWSPACLLTSGCQSQALWLRLCGSVYSRADSPGQSPYVASPALETANKAYC